VCQRRQHYVQPLSTFVEVGRWIVVVCSRVDYWVPHPLSLVNHAGRQQIGSCAVPAVAPIVVCVAMRGCCGCSGRLDGDLASEERGTRKLALQETVNIVIT